ncbi:branched-chain amino acid aminotransferase [Amycolatopsis mediterranei]|uniref:branched-chain amino acid aminotransferase n=1 Tax=Amycolatopsis mediterranei TaxID=33910 RepID=UPI0034172CE9
MARVLDERAAVSAPADRPGHGAAFTDHMYTMSWTAGRGWHAPRLRRLANLSVHPGTLGLHYGQVIFEGLKAFRHPGGGMAVFRPRLNALRFQRSARRLAMPELPAADFLLALEEVVAADHAALSDDPEHSLYLRPLMYGSEANLMLRPSEEYEFLLLAFVAGGFFGDTVAPVSVFVSHDHSRALPGGTGDVKCAANYGPSFMAQRAAADAGCQQVVWLDSVEHRWIEEMGGMNLFFVRGTGSSAEVVTSPLTGTLLPGVTRDSLLVLAARHGYRVTEERISVDQWRTECAAGLITETFACGTAAVVTPVGRVVDQGRSSWTVGDGTMGPVTTHLRTALTDVQRGRSADPDGWLHLVPSAAHRTFSGDS